MTSRMIEILLVEDNPGDARLTLEAFKEGRVVNNLSVVHDGVEALRYLRKEGPYATAKVPDLILLDLNLPKMDGREVLAVIKADEQLRTIPVVVLTTSASQDDILRAYGEKVDDQGMGPGPGINPGGINPGGVNPGGLSGPTSRTITIDNGNAPVLAAGLADAMRKIMG